MPVAAIRRMLQISIAIICNILRIAATGIGYHYFSGESVRLFLHDSAGFIFIPIAIGILVLGIWLYDLTFPRLIAQVPA